MKDNATFRIEADVKKTTLLFILVSIAILAFATWFRVVEIDSRLFHNDEGVNYHFIQELRQRGYYPYSHENYHGPIYFYMTAAMLMAFPDDGELGMRISAILAGLALIALLLFCKRVIGWRTVLLAAFLTASSSSLVFYSRYAIHETLFLLSSAGVAFALYCWHKCRLQRYIWLGWVSLAVLICTKETFIISLFCIFWAFVSLGEWRSIVRSLYDERRALFWGALLMCVIIIVTFTGGLRWPGGIREMFLAVPQWVGRNTSDVGHHKPFAYYLDIIRESEPYLYLLIAPLIGKVRNFLASGDWLLFICMAFVVLGSSLSRAVRSRLCIADRDARNFVILWASLIAIVYCLSLFNPDLYGRKEIGALHRALLFFPALIALFTIAPEKYSSAEYRSLTQAAAVFFSFLVVCFGWLLGGDFRAILLVCFLLFSSYAIAMLLFHIRAVAIWCLSPEQSFLRFTSIWALTSWLVYGFVKYKTPWLIINITFPAILVLSSLLVHFVSRGGAQRMFGFVCVIAVGVTSIYYSYLYNFVVTDTQKNKFYYVHTTPGMRVLVDELLDVWRLKPDAKVLIGVGQYWPLPYYIRNHAKKVAYLNTKDFKKHASKYDVLILPKLSMKTPEGWRKTELRLSDVQETHTFFKVSTRGMLE